MQRLDHSKILVKSDGGLALPLFDDYGDINPLATVCLAGKDVEFFLSDTTIEESMTQASMVLSFKRCPPVHEESYLPHPEDIDQDVLDVGSPRSWIDHPSFEHYICTTNAMWASPFFLTDARELQESVATASIITRKAVESVLALDGVVTARLVQRKVFLFVIDSALVGDTATTIEAISKVLRSYYPHLMRIALGDK